METIILKTQQEIKNFLTGEIKVDNMNARLSMKGLEKWKKQMFNVCWDATIKDGYIAILSMPNLDQKEGVFTLLEKNAKLDKTKSRYLVKVDEIEEIILEKYN